jgi:glycosyltransferase involved in cell wall biosynthesis
MTGPGDRPPDPVAGALGSGPTGIGPTLGVRVVLDARPLQEPARAPVTAAYLDALLRAYAARPVEGESFAFLLRSDLDDPTAALGGLSVVGRRLLPPTHLLRSGAMTLDPFLLRGASLGAAWRAERGGASGAVYHTAGAGPLPIASGLPVVATLLDLAPWELPEAFGRSRAARFGQRLRGQLLRDAAAVIVAGPSVASAARRLLHIRSDRIHVIPLAARPEFMLLPHATTSPVSTGAADDVAERERLGLAGRYLVYPGRYDARQDLATLLLALAALAEAGRPAELPDDVEWPPRILLLGASPEDRASLARAAARQGISASLTYARGLPSAASAGLLRGARAAILPVVSESAGLAAIEALACGTPVVASAVGILPGIVGTAGVLVEARDPDRLATALRTIWTDDRVHGRLAAAARRRAGTAQRTWDEIAAETRAVYATVGIRRG